MGQMREASYFSLVALMDGPAHGYAILTAVKDISGNDKMTVGALYSALEALVEQGLVARTGSEIVSGRLRQYFEITEDGVAGLQREADRMAAAAAVGQRAAGRSPDGAIPAGQRRQRSARRPTVSLDPATALP